MGLDLCFGGASYTYLCLCSSTSPVDQLTSMTVLAKTRCQSHLTHSKKEDFDVKSGLMECETLRLWRVVPLRETATLVVLAAVDQTVLILQIFCVAKYRLICE